MPQISTLLLLPPTPTSRPQAAESRGSRIRMSTPGREPSGERTRSEAFPFFNKRNALDGNRTTVRV